MARQLRDDEIGQDTLVDYLETRSDFHFELKILKMMRDHGLPCEHGGHYSDPVTRKSREFDIRCRVAHDRCHVQLAVECKNLKNNFPLLISALPRTVEESYHDTVVIADPPIETREILGETIEEESLESRALPVRVKGHQSIYRPRDIVGKSTSQVGLSASKDSEIVFSDSDIYEKWGQCVSSLTDLISETERMRILSRPNEWLVATAIPILVIPDGTLWCVSYSENGIRIDNPKQVHRVSVFAGMKYRLRKLADSFNVSHVEFMTESGLKTFIEDHLLSVKAIADAFFQDVKPESLKSEE